MDAYIIFEPKAHQFREFSFNPDADCGMQIVEQIHSFENIKYAFENSKDNEKFSDILDSVAKTYLHDNSTHDYALTETYLKHLSSYTFITKDRLLMMSMTMLETSTCGDCVHHARCEAVYEQVDGRSCKDDPVTDCDFFIHQNLIK